MKRIFVLLLITSLFLSGCKGNSTVGSEFSDSLEQLTETEESYAPSVVLTNVYKPMRLQDDGLIVGSTQAFADLVGMEDSHHIKHKYGDASYLYCLERRMDNNQWIIAVFDWEGNLLEQRTPPPFTEEYGYSKDQRWLADGGAVFLYGETNKDTTVYRLAADGTVTGTLDLPGANKNTAALAASEDRIAVVCDGTLWILDTDDLQVLARHAFPYQTETLWWREDGMLVCQNSMYTLYTVDPATGESVRMYSVPDTGTDVQLRQYYGPGYDLYMTRTDGIYGVTLTEDGKGTETLLLHWENSILTPEGTTIEWIADPEHFLVRSSDNIYEMPENVILRRSAEEAQSERTEVVMAYFLETVDGRELRRLVSAFNREHEQYFLRLVQYPRVVMSENPEEASKKIFGEMEGDNKPDLLILSADMEALYRNLQKQGYLADLSSLAENLTGSARSAVQYGEVYTRIPVTIRYETLVSCQIDHVLDMDTLLAVREKQEILFSENLSMQLSDCIQSTFVDWRNRTAAFEMDAFRQYMTLLADIPELIEEEYGKIYNDGILRVTNSELPVYAADGRLPFVPVDLHTIETFGAMNLCFGEDAYTICGYPDALSVPEVPISLTVLKDGKNVPGARAFLAFALSDAVQTSGIVTDRNLPVTSSALKLLLADTYYYYSMDLQYDGQVNIQSACINLYGSYREPIEEYRENTDINEVIYTEENKSAILAFLENENVTCIPDPAVRKILFEELYAYRSGDRTMEDTVQILQSRVSTYLAE